MTHAEDFARHDPDGLAGVGFGCLTCTSVFGRKKASTITKSSLGPDTRHDADAPSYSAVAAAIDVTSCRPRVAEMIRIAGREKWDR